MHYDIVVIGAGIQGVGVAQAAAAAGYSVLVLEQKAIAAGTSSKSSKLIHGGLRYLESAQFGLVRESLRERAVLLKVAPELVKLQPLHIPLYRESRRSPLTIRAGLSMYSVLAGLSNTAHFRSLSTDEWDSLVGLKQEGLREVFRYYEAQTDDAALTAAVLRSAVSLGAEALIPARFIAADVNNQQCRVDYEYQAQQHSVTCDVLMNCTGPWATDVLARITPTRPLPSVELVQGSHLVLPPLLHQYFYLEAPQDKRAVFVLPWKEKLLVGTTETIHLGAPEDARCLDSERDYLLQTLGHYFPGLNLADIVIDSFAGLRVLPRSEKSAFFRPREVLLDVDNTECPRVLSLMGGKLTTYRATALTALERVRVSLPQRNARGDTAELPLSPE
jgi:glycerol-3-phosphate dehydrogenase